jgi:hypothetical protein
VQPNIYQPKSGIFVTSITLEFLDTYGIQLGKCHTHDALYEHWCIRCNDDVQQAKMIMSKGTLLS